MKNVIGDFDKEEVQMIVDLYQKDRQAGFERMLTKINKYISQVMFGPKYYEYSRNPNFYDDIKQQIYLEVMTAMDSYNIEKGAPVTYFQPFIKAGIRKVIDDHNGFTSHYSSICRKIRQLQAERAKKRTSNYCRRLHFRNAGYLSYNNQRGLQTDVCKR